MVADKSPDPDTVLQAEWTTMRASAMGAGELMLDECQEFAVFNRANQLIMKIPAQYPSQGKQAYLILEMAMNHIETPDELVSSVHLPLGLKVSSINRKKTTFEATEDHQKLLKESCGPSPSTKLRTNTTKRKDNPTSEASTPKSTKKENPRKSSNLHPLLRRILTSRTTVQKNRRKPIRGLPINLHRSLMTVGGCWIFPP